MPNELPIPPEAPTASKSRESVRGWILDGLLHCSLNVGFFGKKQPAYWGVFLSDVAHHFADALHQENGWDQDNPEIATPSARFTGDFV